MFKRHGIVWVLALGLVLVGGIAVADEGAKKDDVAKLHKAATDAKVTFAQAIEAAQKEVADGKIIEVELEAEEGKPVFEVDLLVGDVVKEVTICGVEGKVIKTEDEKEPGEELEAAKKAVPGAKTSFVEALEAAQKEAKDAKPVEIKLTLVHDAPMYAVEFVTAEAKSTVHVDAVEGKVHAGH